MLYLVNYLKEESILGKNPVNLGGISTIYLQSEMLIDNDGQFLKFPLSHFIYHVEVKDGGTLLHHNLATSNFPFFYYIWARLLKQGLLYIWTENKKGVP